MAPASGGARDFGELYRAENRPDNQIGRQIGRARQGANWPFPGMRRDVHGL